MEKHIADLFHRVVDGLSVHEKEREKLHAEVDAATDKAPEGGSDDAEES